MKHSRILCGMVSAFYRDVARRRKDWTGGTIRNGEILVILPVHITGAVMIYS